MLPVLEYRGMTVGRILHAPGHRNLEDQDIQTRTATKPPRRLWAATEVRAEVYMLMQC